MNIRGNQQFQDTHNKILYTVLELLQTKELRQITVAEICRSVGINRSTFYEHFVNINDVINKTAREYAASIAEIITESIDISYRETTLQVLIFIRDRKVFYKQYVRQGRQLHIPEDLMAGGLKERKIKTTSELWNDDPILAGYQWEHMKGSFNAIIREWLRRDCKETPEQIYDILSKLSGNGMVSL